MPLCAEDELHALMQELQAVQKAPTAFKLSEPNVVEVSRSRRPGHAFLTRLTAFLSHLRCLPQVMQKLVELKLVEVLFTSNGKEYVTPGQLCNEVEDEVIAHGGRVNLAELTPILNVDLLHVERAVCALLERVDSMQLFHGELIADHYLDGVAEEVNTTLQGSGRVTLAELAVHYTLPTSFMAKIIEARLGSIVQAKLAAGVLYTSAYVSRHSARVRGVLSALLRPTSLAQLVREHGFNESLFYECVEALRAEGQLAGTVQGKSSYTPALHTHAQVAGVRSFYEQNGLIEYAALSMMAVRDPRAYLQTTYPGGIALPTRYIAREKLDALEIELDEACASGGALDVNASVPLELDGEEVDALLGASSAVRDSLQAGRVVALGDGLLASAALLGACAEAPALEALISATAEQRAQGAASRSDGPKASKCCTAAEAGAQAGDGGKRKGVGGVKSGKRGARREEAMIAALEGFAALDDSDEDELSGKKAKVAKKGKRGKATGGSGLAPSSGGSDGCGGDSGGDGDLLGLIE